MDKSSLSPIARKLADAVGENGSVTAELKKDPALMAGLDEYTKWREEEGKRIGGKRAPKAMGHEVGKLVKQLRRPQPKRKK